MLISKFLFVCAVFEVIGMMTGPLLSMDDSKATSRARRGFRALGSWLIHCMAYGAFLYLLDMTGGAENLLSASHNTMFAIFTWVAALIGLGVVTMAFVKKMNKPLVPDKVDGVYRIKY